MINTMRKVEDHENHVRWIYLTTVLYMGESQKYARTLVIKSDYHSQSHFLKLVATIICTDPP